MSSDQAELLRAVRASANGMLPLEVYERLYELAYHSEGGTFVEIGTAHGAATIALALGAKEGGHAFRIYTVDPFGGKYSSRSAFGTVDDNVAFVREQFDKFGVAEYIEIVVGNSSALLRDHDVKDIKLLFLDADGRIDRDLANLYNRLSEGCNIAIDDIDDHVHAIELNGISLLDQKHRLGALLVKRFIAHDLLSPESTVQATGFFKKGKADAASDEILLAGLPAYRELVFADISHILGAVGRRAEVRRHPRLHRGLQALKSVAKTGIKLAFNLRNNNVLYGSQLDGFVYKVTDGRVVSGPFRSMKYTPHAAGSSLAPKILGTYELELHPWLEFVINKNYGIIHNVGCGEGYYSVGMGLRKKDCLIRAYDVDPTALDLLKELARLNGVNERIELRPRMERADIAQQYGPQLVICDIEGAEVSLLDPRSMPSLLDSDILVEVHDGGPGGTIRDGIVSRFEASHNILQTSARPRTLADMPRSVAELFVPELALAAMNEHRQHGLTWLLMLSRAGDHAARQRGAQSLNSGERSGNPQAP